ncbi:hypothetical protein HYW46_04015 [Candidatus Daviesbacteria bacterium]|nr:hypothetical protein [Candidatus Daviesbacteria bacterium]
MQKGFSAILVLVMVLLLAAIGGGAYYFGKQSNTSETLPKQSKRVDIKLISPSPSPAPVDETAKWKTYIIKTLSLEFKLPPEIGSLGELTEVIEPGQTGTQLCVSFTKPLSLIKNAYAGGFCVTEYPLTMNIGTTSVDYSQGRGGTFTDLQGFKYQDGKYLTRFVNGQFLEEFPQDLITKVQNNNGVEIIKIKPHLPLDDGPSLRNTLPEGWVGVVMNTKNTTYPGLALKIQLSDKVNEQLVDKILSTFQFN